MSFSATVSDRTGGVRLLLRGEIDLATRDSLRHALRSAFRRTAGVIEVDLREVTFLDCAGVGAIVEGHQVAGRAGLTLIVTHDHGIVRRVLDLSGVRNLLDPGHGHRPPAVEAVQ